MHVKIIFDPVISSSAAVCVLTASLLGISCNAADIKFKNSITGNWTSGTNWTTNLPPGIADRAFIADDASTTAGNVAQVTSIASVDFVYVGPESFTSPAKNGKGTVEINNGGVLTIGSSLGVGRNSSSTGSSPIVQGVLKLTGNGQAVVNSKKIAAQGMVVGGVADLSIPDFPFTESAASTRVHGNGVVMQEGTSTVTVNGVAIIGASRTLSATNTVDFRAHGTYSLIGDSALTVNRYDSTTSGSGNMYVGGFGVGALNLSGNAIASVSSMFVNTDSKGLDPVTVNEPSTLSIADNAQVLINGPYFEMGTSEHGTISGLTPSKGAANATQSGGLMRMTSIYSEAEEFDIGDDGGSGIYTITGGELDAHAAKITVGESDEAHVASKSILDISGSTTLVRAGHLLIGKHTDTFVKLKSGKLDVKYDVTGSSDQEIGNAPTSHVGAFKFTGGTLRFRDYQADVLGTLVQENTTAASYLEVVDILDDDSHVISGGYTLKSTTGNALEAKVDVGASGFVPKLIIDGITSTQGNVKITGNGILRADGGLQVGVAGASTLTKMNKGAIVVKQANGGLNIDSTDSAIDLNQSLMIVDYTGQTSPYNTIFNYLQSGFNNSGTTWNGLGIMSSAARDDAAAITAIGMMNNAGTYMIFDPTNDHLGHGGETVPFHSILLKYTYYGDTDLNGVVDGDDQTAFLVGYTNHLHGWENGDFDYNGVVDGDDQTLFLIGYSNQGAPLGTGDVHPVPEPRAAFSLVCGALTVLAIMMRKPLWRRDLR